MLTITQLNMFHVKHVSRETLSGAAGQTHVDVQKRYSGWSYARKRGQRRDCRAKTGCEAD